MNRLHSYGINSCQRKLIECHGLQKESIAIAKLYTDKLQDIGGKGVEFEKRCCSVDYVNIHKTA
jgi:hypothetical protein